MKNICLIFSLFILILNISFGVEEKIISKDDLFKYSIKELKIHLDAENYLLSSPLKENIASNDKQTLSILRIRLKELAFKNLLVYEASKSVKLTSQQEKSIKETLRNSADIFFNQEITDSIKITTDTVKKEYEKIKENYKSEEQRRIAVLYRLFPNDEGGRQKIIKELQELRKKPDLNKNFIDYVRKYSDLPGASEGGIVNYFAKGTYGPILEKYAFSTPKGELSDVFSATKGAYIIKCLDIIPAGYKKFSDLAPGLRNELLKKKSEEIRKVRIKEMKEKNQYRVVSFIPKTISNDFFLYKVNDYECKYGDLLDIYPKIGEQFADNSEKFAEYIEKTAEKELISQYIQSKITKEPNSDLAKKMNYLKNDIYFRLYIDVMTSNKFDVKETEMREYYSKVKDFYHEPAQKRIGYILSKIPTPGYISEPEYFKQVEDQKRQLMELREQAIKDPKNFKTLAEAYKVRNPNSTYTETSWLDKLPEEWPIPIDITEFSEKMPSPVYKLNDNFLLFKVIGTNPGRILAFDEVKDKVMRVILSDKKNKMIEKLKEDTLKKYNFQILF